MTSIRRRALLITPDYPPLRGGIARLLAGLVSSTSDTVQWRVLTRAAGAEDAGTVRVAGTRDLWSRIPAEIRWLRSSEESLVVCGHAFGLGPALVAGRLAGVPVATIVYGMELVSRRVAHRLILGALIASARVVAISRHSADVAERLGVRPERIKVVNPAPAPPSAREGRPLGRSVGEGVRLVAVSRLAEGYKNLELLLRIVSVLAPSRVVSRLTIIGDGPRRLALEERALALGIDKHVHFAGGLDDAEMARVLADSHIGLFPSRDSLAEGGFEGFGLVVQEMASAGLPVLVGRAGGAVDAAGPGWSVLLDPDNLRTWIGAIDALAGDEPARLRMAESALTSAREVDHRRAAHSFFEALAG